MSLYIGIKRRGGTAAAWTAANPILLERQWGFETDSFTLSGGIRYYKFKIGDGTTAWNSLPYAHLAPSSAAAAAAWGTITGTLSAQTDLQAALDAKQNTGNYFNKTSDDTDDITQGVNKFISAAELTKLGTIETSADVTDAGNVGNAIDGTTALATPVDADKIPWWDSVAGLLKHVTYANLKSKLGALYVALTGDQTIAGVKTFSSDPLIPDEAYGAGWNGSLEPPTKNAVYDKIETIGGGGLEIGVTTIASGTVGRIPFHGASDLLQESANFSIDESGTDKILKIGGTAQGRIELRVGGNLKAYATSEHEGRFVAGGDDVANTAYGYTGGQGGMGFPSNLKIVFGMGGATMLYMQVSSIFQNGLAGITAPTAKLHIPSQAAGAGTAPIKLDQSATLMTTPEVGAIESDSTKLYWTNGAGTRKEIQFV